MDIDPDKLTPEMLDELADHLIAKALKEKGLNSPEMVAKVAKRLEAGETVTEEDLEMERPNVDDEPRCSSVSIIKVIK
jgi:flagella basal body P-ring formation protein FlgA